MPTSQQSVWFIFAFACVCGVILYLFSKITVPIFKITIEITLQCQIIFVSAKSLLMDCCFFLEICWGRIFSFLIPHHLVWRHLISSFTVFELKTSLIIDLLLVIEFSFFNSRISTHKF